MEVKLSPIPGWAWDLIEQVERGERRLWQESPSVRRMLTHPREQLVSELVWETRRGTRYDRMASRVHSGKIRATDPEATLANLERAKGEHTRSSSGHAEPYSGRIVVTAGWDETDQRLVLLHELGHLLAPAHEWHGKKWRQIVARLYAKYGGTEMVAYAQAHERPTILKRYLRERYPEVESQRQVDGTTRAIMKLKDELSTPASVGVKP